MIVSKTPEQLFPVMEREPREWTPEERNQVVDWLASLSLEELRFRQEALDLDKAPTWMPVETAINVQVMRELLRRAVEKKEFA